LFVPLANRLYGKGLLVLYFDAGILGQAFHYWWSPMGGGSSGAAFAVMGGLVTYIFRNRRFASKPFVVLATVPLIAAAVLAMFRDGHGPSLLIGAFVAAWLPNALWPVENPESPIENVSASS
jgi:membrane associated rhomboid family serine protease